MLNRDIIPFNRNTYKSKSHYDYSFAASGPSVWNSLPEYVRCCDSLYSFSASIEGLPVPLSFSSIAAHFSRLTFLDVDHFLSPISIMDINGALEYVKRS